MVLGAASLTEVFDDLAREFEREHPGVRVVASYAGSQTLVIQVAAGGPADVIATASPEALTRLVELGRIGNPTPFASNRLVWIVRPELHGVPLAPGSDVESLVLAAPEVPAGAYARRALDELGLRERALALVRSEELDVRGVVAKVIFGVADAGLVYATDVTPEVAARVRVVELPEGTQVSAEYVAAVVRDSDQSARARAFVGLVTGPEGRPFLLHRGFRPLP